MSIKTSLKKVAVIAAMALTLGGFTAISANAAVSTTAALTTTAGAVGTPVATGVAAGVDLTFSSGAGSTTISVNGGAEVSWTAAQTSGTAMTFSSNSGNGSDSFTITKGGGGTTVHLDVTSTTAVNHTITSSDGMTPLTVYVTGAVSNDDGTVVISAPSAISAGNPATGFVGQPVVITAPGYGFTATSVAATGSGVDGTASHAFTATVSGPAAVSGSGFNTPSAVSATPANVTVVTPAATGTSTGSNTLTTTVTSAASGTSAITVSATDYHFTASAAGTYTVTFSGAPLTSITRTVVISADTSQAIWRQGLLSTATVGTPPSYTDPTSIALTATVTGPAQYVDLVSVAGLNTIPAGAGNYDYVEVSGSTIANAPDASFLNGTLNVGTTLGTATIATWSNGNTPGVGSHVWINASAAATATVKFYAKRTDSVSGLSTSTLLQTVTITVSAPGALNPVVSTSVINGVVANGVTATKSASAGYVADQTILAPATLAAAGGVVSGVTTAKATIRVQLKDAAGASLIGTLPAVGVSISGPGTLSLSTTNGSANTDASTGRYLTVAAAAAGTTGSPFAAGTSTFYVNVFSDGTSGVSTISIWINGAVWTTETMSFYGAPTKLVAAGNLKVLKTGITSGSCGTVATCDGSTVALTPAVAVLATDANGIAVPGVSYTAVPDKTVVTASAVTSRGTAADTLLADSLGATWFDVTTASLLDSGKTGSVSYKTTVAGVDLVSNTVSFAIGGAATAFTLATGGVTEVGGLNSLTVTAKDASGNAPYDQDVDAALASNVSVTAAIGGGSFAAPSFAIIGGTSGAKKFYNPLIAGTVTFSGVIGPDDTAVTTSFDVSNSAVNAAADAAAEATDAANAATDAANAAAEAADAATAAAQDAADAVAALSAQVTAMISALKKQLIALTNLVIKIQKKVRA